MILLGGSWVVISRVTTIAITHIRGLLTPRITTHEPPSRGPGEPMTPELRKYSSGDEDCDGDHGDG